MQYNHIFNLKKARYISVLPMLIKLLIFGFVGAYMIYVVRNKQNFGTEYKSMALDITAPYGYLLLVPIILFIFNWAVEAVKWQYLSREIEKLSFLKAFRGILTGVTLGFATPFHLGDYVGRILQLESSERAKGLGAVFLSRIAQFYITLVCGSTSLLYFIFKVENFDNLFNGVIIFFVVITNILFIALLLFHNTLLYIIKEIRIFKRVYKYFEIITHYTFNEISYVLFLSFIRYVIFSSQFVIILFFFGVSRDIGILILGVNFIFLAKSVIPTFFDLGVRETSAVYFFEHFIDHTDKVIFASLSLWAINILLPALIGMFLIFRIKIFTKS
jgi:uncharacterized membrane protein YbhN (UPF0104 family)